MPGKYQESTSKVCVKYRLSTGKVPEMCQENWESPGKEMGKYPESTEKVHGNEWENTRKISGKY